MLFVMASMLLVAALVDATSEIRTVKNEICWMIVVYIAGMLMAISLGAY